MENQPKSNWSMDKLFATPPWKSRAFLVLSAAVIGLVFTRLLSTPFVGSETERNRAFGRIVGLSVVDVLFWIVPPYLFLLLLELGIRRAQLTPTQTRVATILAAVVAACLVPFMVALFPPKS